MTCQAPEVLADGSYEAIVVDADEAADQPGVMALTIAIVAGPAKGEVVEVLAAQLQYEAIDLLAMPCIVTVAGGQPKLVFD